MYLYPFSSSSSLVHSVYSQPELLLNLHIKRDKHYYNNVIKDVCLLITHVKTGLKNHPKPSYFIRYWISLFIIVNFFKSNFTNSM